MSTSGERVLPASPRRKQQAAESGQRAGANSLSASLGLLALAIGMGSFGPRAAVAVTALARVGFGGGLVTEPLVLRTLRAAVLWPAAVAAGASVLCGVALTGGRLPWSALRPNVPNPVNTLRQQFGAEGMARFGRSLLTALGVTAVAIGPVWTLIRASPGLLGNPSGAVAAVAAALWAVLWRGGALLAVVGMAEAVFRQWQFGQSIRMTHAEAREERKQTEGDPQLRMRRRRMHMALVRRRQLLDVADATVVVANPEHYAIALRYRPGSDLAPVVLAKGVDAFALRIRDAAFAAGVPVREEPALARSLYPVARVGQPIPAALYQAVAVVVAWAMRGRVVG